MQHKSCLMIRTTSHFCLSQWMQDPKTLHTHFDFWRDLIFVHVLCIFSYGWQHHSRYCHDQCCHCWADHYGSHQNSLWQTQGLQNCEYACMSQSTVNLIMRISYPVPVINLLVRIDFVCEDWFSCPSTHKCMCMVLNTSCTCNNKIIMKEIFTV